MSFQNNNSSPYPGSGGYYPPMNWYIPQPQPETPQQQEGKRLRKDGNYVGIMMLALTAGMQLTFTVVALILCVVGVLDFSQLTSPTLGLDNTSYLLLYACIYSFAMAVPAVIVALCFRRRHFPLSPASPVRGADAFLGVLGAMGVCMLANLVSSYIVAFFSQFGVEPPEMPDMLVETPTSLLLNILVLAVLPALLEELVFRGYVLRTLRPYGDWFAVAVSALLFGLMHGNIAQIPFAIIVGIALGWLYVATDNIWLPVFVHFANNTLSVGLDYLSRSLSGQWQNLFAFVVILAVAFLGCLAILGLALRRSALFRKPPRRSLLTTTARVGNLLKAPAFVICVIVFVLLTLVSML